MTKRGKPKVAILAGSTLLLLSLLSLQFHLPGYFAWIFLIAGLGVVSVNVWGLMKSGEKDPDSK